MTLLSQFPFLLCKCYWCFLLIESLRPYYESQSLNFYPMGGLYRKFLSLFSLLCIDVFFINEVLTSFHHIPMSSFHSYYWFFFSFIVLKKALTKVFYMSFKFQWLDRRDQAGMSAVKVAHLKKRMLKINFILFYFLKIF